MPEWEPRGRPLTLWQAATRLPPVCNLGAVTSQSTSQTGVARQFQVSKLLKVLVDLRGLEPLTPWLQTTKFNLPNLARAGAKPGGSASYGKFREARFAATCTTSSASDCD